MARSVVTIDDLSNDEIERLFDLADKFLAKDTHRVRGRGHIADEFVLSTLFYEPSTRTRFSFETAMLRLGGHILSSADPKSTSAAKGESLADTVRVVENYADIIVLRHPVEGAARVAADFADVPVINAGDGSHEHPTQTLCDLYTLKREGKKLKGLNVLLCGDLRNGRTIHSLVYALARFGAHIMPFPAKGLELPDHVQERLEREYHCVPFSVGPEAECDVVYVTPDSPHTPALFPDLKVSVESSEFTATKQRLIKSVLSQIDVFYVTRLQKERLHETSNTQYQLTIDKDFLKGSRYKHSSVLHPLPRVAELGYDMDADPRAVYFKQASYGVPVRMALLTALLGLERRVLGDHAIPVLDSKNRTPVGYPLYSSDQGLTCPAPNCVTRSESERRYLVPKFLVVRDDPLTLRCAYCEHETKPCCFGNRASKKFRSHTHGWKATDISRIVFFQNVQDAKTAQFEPYK